MFPFLAIVNRAIMKRVEEACYNILKLFFLCVCFTGIVVPPKGNLDIPVLFIPTSMTLYKTMVIVKVKRANKENWLVDNFDELNAETKR